MEQTKTAEQVLQESFYKHIERFYPITFEEAKGENGNGYNWIYEAMEAYANQYRNPVAVTISEPVLTPDHFACIVEHPELYTGSLLCAKCNQHWDGISKCKRETPTVAPSETKTAPQVLLKAQQLKEVIAERQTVNN